MAAKTSKTSKTSPSDRIRAAIRAASRRRILGLGIEVGSFELPQTVVIISGRRRSDEIAVLEIHPTGRGVALRFFPNSDEYRGAADPIEFASKLLNAAKVAERLRYTALAAIR